eukprot:gene18180-18430_t
MSRPEICIRYYVLFLQANKTPLDLARDNNHQEVIVLLQNWASNNGETVQGVNDSCKGGIDRLGYEYYSQAIFEVVSTSEPSLCVGLYARWGSGKSFLIELIKRKFDPNVKEQKGSRELIQYFEDGYTDKKPETIPSKFNIFEWENIYVAVILALLAPISMFRAQVSDLSMTAPALIYSVILSADLVLNSMVFFVLVRSRFGLSTAYIKELDKISPIWKEFILESGLAIMCRALLAFTTAVTVVYTLNPDNIPQSWKSPAIDTETAVKRNAPAEVHDKPPSPIPNTMWQSDVIDAALAIATVTLLLESEIGFNLINALTLMLFAIGKSAIDWSFAQEILFPKPKTTDKEFIEHLFVNFNAWEYCASDELWAGMIRGLYQKSAEIDRGLVIYSEAISVKDKIGFMAKVRKELSALFNFINEDFKELTGTQLRLVLFIDDLDRCLEGRNVKMLEAIQLLLNVPGAPVFIFLAIDSRVVV